MPLGAACIIVIDSTGGGRGGGSGMLPFVISVVSSVGAAEDVTDTVETPVAVPSTRPMLLHFSVTSHKDAVFIKL